MAKSLETSCREYLEHGPPSHMETYLPGSLTEIIIAHGARGESLDAELVEIAQIIVIEAEYASDEKDEEIRAYLQRGSDLVKRVVEADF